jgi:hypothetical protein
VRRRAHRSTAGLPCLCLMRGRGWMWTRGGEKERHWPGSLLWMLDAGWTDVAVKCGEATSAVLLAEQERGASTGDKAVRAPSTAASRRGLGAPDRRRCAWWERQPHRRRRPQPQLKGRAALLQR